jgi:hypothetical protein
MFIKKTSAWCSAIAFFLLASLRCDEPCRAYFSHGAHHGLDITVAQLHNDTSAIRKYVVERIANDLKKAKRWGKGAAKAFAGISSYAFDAIPFEFFNSQAAIDQVFKRLEEGVGYIREVREAFKKNVLGNKKKINQSQLAEFLYGQVVTKIHVTDDQRAILRKDPIRMDEFVRRGIVSKDEYMYFTLLNFVVRYYLELEFKK